jgi:signal transduction histidine kinase/PAS domain-containing protein
MVIEPAAGSGMAAVAVISVLWGGALWRRSQARWRRAEAARSACEQRRDELATILGALADAAFRWSDGDAAAVPPGYREFLAGLLPADAARIEDGRRRLQQDGTPFSAVVTLQGGATAVAVRVVEGRQAANGDTVLWSHDGAAVRSAEAQRAAAESTATRLREMIDAIPLPLWRRDAELGLVDCNEAYAAALNERRERVLAERRELITRNARAARAASPAGRSPDQVHGLPLHPRNDASRTGVDGSRRERRHVVIAGSRRLLEISERPAPSGGTVGYAIDRTDVETAEAELLRHISAHAQVLESIHAAVAIFGADKRLKFFNAGYAALWGLDEEWLAHEPSLEEIMEQLRERRRLPEVVDFRAYKRERLALFTSLIEPQQELMHLPDDRTIRLAVSPHPFGGLLFVAEDVTDRLAIERLYNTLSAVQRATLDHLFEGIAVFGSDGRLKLHNPAYRALWGLSEADVAGEPHIGEIVGKMRPYFDESGNWPAIMEGIVAKVMAHTLSSGPLYRHDGSVLQVVTVPLPDGNILLTYLDVSDSARVERALRERNEALETAARLKSEFIANVSYELRTPLNAVIGFAEILAHQYFGTLNPRQLDYAHSILESANQLMTLINDIIDLATIEAGYMTLETETVAVEGMLHAVLTLTRERARNREIELRLRCPSDIGGIEADERRLKQALFNLVTNAIRFTPPGGTVTIAAARDGDDLLLSVADTGIGIRPADQARIFEKFERASRHSGAGLGLSLVRSLIDLHGGTIAIESEPDRGTKVTCRIPAGRKSAVPPSLAASATGPTG